MLRRRAARHVERTHGERARELDLNGIHERASAERARYNALCLWLDDLADDVVDHAIGQGHLPDFEQHGVCSPLGMRQHLESVVRKNWHTRVPIRPGAVAIRDPETGTIVILDRFRGDGGSMYVGGDAAWRSVTRE